MNIKVLVSFLLIFVGHQVANAQNEGVWCNYSTQSFYGYTCDVKIINPNGRDDFSIINGTHLAGKSDADVMWIYHNSTSKSNTTNVPSVLCDSFSNVQSISIRFIKLQQILENSFKNCKKLTNLDLEANRIAEIDEKSFINNSELTIIYLGNNKLTTLSENTFINQHKLQTLYLFGNQISDLPPKIFKSLGPLESLHLSGNKISKLRAEWFEPLENLNVLTLYQNQIEELPPNIFSSLKKLTTLDLSNNKIKIVNSNSFFVPLNLTIIWAFNNQIDAIDEKLINSTRLTQLQLRGNKCTNKDFNSTTMELVPTELKVCFDNFEDLMTALPPICSDDDLASRVCSLEDENEEFNENFWELRAENHALNLSVEKLNGNIQELRAENQQQNVAIQELRSENQELRHENVQLHLKVENLMEKVNVLEKMFWYFVTRP